MTFQGDIETLYATEIDVLASTPCRAAYLRLCEGSAPHNAVEAWGDFLRLGQNAPTGRGMTTEDVGAFRLACAIIRDANRPNRGHIAVHGGLA
ncbi:hypothetical protein [Gymnodinialimonas sp.]